MGCCCDRPVCLERIAVALLNFGLEKRRAFAQITTLSIYISLEGVGPCESVKFQGLPESREVFVFCFLFWFGLVFLQHQSLHLPFRTLDLKEFTFMLHEMFQVRRNCYRTPPKCKPQQECEGRVTDIQSIIITSLMKILRGLSWIFLKIYLFIFILCMWAFYFHVCTWIACMPGAHEDQRNC